MVRHQVFLYAITKPIHKNDVQSSPLIAWSGSVCHHQWEALIISIKPVSIGILSVWLSSQDKSSVFVHGCSLSNNELCVLPMHNVVNMIRDVILNGHAVDLKKKYI